MITSRPSLCTGLSAVCAEIACAAFRRSSGHAPVGASVPDGPHRRTFEYWRTLVYPSVGVGFYPARRLYFAFSFLPPAAPFLPLLEEMGPPEAKARKK